MDASGIEGAARPARWQGSRPDLAGIWRIVPEDHADRPEPPRLGDASTADLVALLEHNDAWQRSTAQRLLLQRQDLAAERLLRDLAVMSEHPLARVHAAWLLHHAGDLDEKTCLELLRDDHPRLREHGALLAERRLADSDELREAVMDLADDSDDRVRFQAALALGLLDDDAILDPLATIAKRGAEDRWTRIAVASAVPGRAVGLLLTLLDAPHDLADRTDEGRLTLLRELAALVGTRRDPSECADVLEALWQIGDQAGRWRLAGLDGLAEGLGRRGTRLGAFLDELPEPIADRTAEALAGFAETAENPDADPSARLDAIRLLAHAPWDVAASTLSRMLVDEPDQGLRIASAQALAGRVEPEVAGRLLDPWQGLTPAVRREVAQRMLSRPERASALLDAIEHGELTPRDLDTTQARRLRDHRTPEIAERARSLLAASLPAERAAVLQRYQAAIDLPADPHQGREVFRRLCSTCHRMEDHGVAVGPDIGDTRTRTKEALLSDILNPNEAIDANYVSYTVATVDGHVLGGLIASETASALTLMRAEGQSDTVLKQDIEEIRSDGVSLMPEGMEEDLTLQEMADLLDYLKNWRYMDGVVPVGGGN